MGQSPDSSSYNEDKDGLPLIQGNADIVNGLSSPKRYTRSPTKICDAGDILLTVRAPVGAVAIASEQSCIGRGVCSIKANKYIYYFLQSKEKSWAKKAQGSTFTCISSNDIKKLICNYPSESAREKTANFLTTIDSRIEVQNKIIEKLESLKIGIKEKIYLLGKTKEPLERILHEVSEKSTVQNQYPVLSSTVKGLFLQSEYFDRSIASDNNIGYKIVRKGQIIISPQNLWMGNLTFNDRYENGIVSPSYKIYEIDSKYSKKYIHWLLTSKRSFFNYGLVSEQGASIVRRNLNVDAFMELCLPVIKEKSDESKIEKLIKLIDKKLEDEKKKGNLLNQQKQFLLSNLFI